MKKTCTKFGAVGSVFLIALIFGSAAAAPAQSGGNFSIRKHTLEPGRRVTGGSFSLPNASGQPDARSHTGGIFDLHGGFFGPVAVPAPTPTPSAVPTSTPSPLPTTTPSPVATVTSTATPPPCCPGDANNSGSFVDAADFIAVQANFGADNGLGGLGDANCSGSFVDAADFIAVQANFGSDCG